MMAILSQNGLKKAFDGKIKKPATMTNKQWEKLDEKALSMVQLCLATHVLRGALDKTAMADL